MNPFLSIAHIAKRLNRPKIVKWCAAKRFQQLKKEWEKAALQGSQFRTLIKYTPTL